MIKLTIQDPKKNRLIKDIVCEATGLTDAEAKEKLLLAIDPEKKRYVLDDYKSRNITWGENCWQFITDCMSNSYDPTPEMIALIKGNR